MVCFTKIYATGTSNLLCTDYTTTSTGIAAPTTRSTCMQNSTRYCYRATLHGILVPSESRFVTVTVPDRAPVPFQSRTLLLPFHTVSESRFRTIRYRYRPSQYFSPVSFTMPYRYCSIQYLSPVFRIESLLLPSPTVSKSRFNS
jgi:hypothetical protein